ncbi:MAG: hypothetical protein AAGH64_05070 [Planctomycetota bacterium]
MLKRLLNFVLLSQGISSTDEGDTEDKWEKFREQRESWKHERDLERAAPAGDGQGETPKPE